MYRKKTQVDGNAQPDLFGAQVAARAAALFKPQLSGLSPAP